MQKGQLAQNIPRRGDYLPLSGYGANGTGVLNKYRSGRCGFQLHIDTHHDYVLLQGIS